VDFGVAAPQFTTFTVVGPRAGCKVQVYNPVTGNYGWIDEARVEDAPPLDQP